MTPTARFGRIADWFVHLRKRPSWTRTKHENSERFDYSRANQADAFFTIPIVIAVDLFLRDRRQGMKFLVQAILMGIRRGFSFCI